MTAPKVEPVKIKVGPNDRYLILIHGLSGGPEVLAQAGETIQKQFNDWWAGESKFAVLTVAEGVTVELERVEADDKD